MPLIDGLLPSIKIIDERPMNNSRFPILSVVVLLALLGVLAALQYRWLGEISAGERERMQKRLETDTQHFADDFNEEIRNAYFTFQIDPSDWLAKDWKDFNARYELWRSRTKYPELIKDIHFVGRDSPPLRYNAGAQDFEPAEWTESLTKIREQIDRYQVDKIINQPISDSYTLLMGNYAAGKVITETVNQQNITRVEPELSGYLVIKLDENTVNKFISDLAARHFSDSETSNYNVSIFKKFDSKIIYQSSQIQTKAEDASDASIEIFDISNESFRMIVNSRMFTKNKKNITDTERQIIEKNIPPAPRMNPADSLKVFFDN
ncbi:MAG TPA: hypothetical protein VGD05_10530, partial [Pyrinomonadaceae bacterium]